PYAPHLALLAWVWHRTVPAPRATGGARVRRRIREGISATCARPVEVPATASWDERFAIAVVLGRWPARRRGVAGFLAGPEAMFRQESDIGVDRAESRPINRSLVVGPVPHARCESAG
ncbi:hypothetical protein ACFYOY_46090, partial [Streptomyces sp. NPDC007875]|uniref:hypothetical protein n=1 Tax=Streptomyces sp. NPDC007875 TaxID=3364783 RepID=UPI00367AFC93